MKNSFFHSKYWLVVATAMMTCVIASGLSNVSGDEGVQNDPSVNTPVVQTKKKTPKNKRRQKKVQRKVQRQVLYGYKDNRYGVSPQESLSEIALRLYGNGNFWKKIAKWNHLKSPYLIKAGQILVISEAPTLTAEQGANKILAMWRKKMGLSTGVDTELAQNSVEKRELASASPQAGNASSESTPATSAPAEPPKYEALMQEYEQEVEKERAVEEGEAPQDTAQTPTPGDPSAPNGGAVATQAPKKVRELNAEDHLKLGEKLFENKEFEAALSHFHKSRELDPALPQPWFYELRALRLLKRDDEANSTTSLFLNKHPEFKDLPMFSTASNAGGNSSQ